MEVAVVEAGVPAGRQFDYLTPRILRDRVGGLPPPIAVMHPIRIGVIVVLLQPLHLAVAQLK